MLYALGFFRHLSWSMPRGGNDPGVDGTVGRWLGLFAVAAVAASLMDYGLRRGGRAWIDHSRLFLLLASCGACMAAAIATGLWRPGAAAEGFSPRGGEFSSPAALVTGAAWILWFAWSVWLVFAGSRENRGGLISLGVYGAAFGLVTRYFDLVGTLEETGRTSYLAA